MTDEQQPAKRGRPPYAAEDAGADGADRTRAPRQAPVGAPPPRRAGRRRRAMKKRAADVLPYFDRPYTSRGPTATIARRQEHLRGFPNLTTDIASCPFEAGGSRPNPYRRSWKTQRTAADGSPANADTDSRSLAPPPGSQIPAQR